MRKVVSFSGGRTSAYLCHLMIEKYGSENVDFIFMDTGAEHPKTYEFIKKCNEYFGLKLVCLRAKFNPEMGKGTTYNIIDVSDLNPDLKPFKSMMSKYGVPYIGGMFCTDRMKLTPYKKYCDDSFGKNGYVTWLGIRVDEEKRLKDVQGIKYLADISDFDKQDVNEFWKSMPFDLEIEDHLGNCIFCPKKSNLKLAAAQREEPKEYFNFLEAINDSSVRVGEKAGSRDLMYRGKQSLQKLISMFDGSTGEEIKTRIRGGRMNDSNSCSESCEVFNCQLDWVGDL